MTGRAELVEQLRALGVAPGAPLMVHASLKRIGAVAGGTDGLIGALVDSLTPGGTLLMVLGADPATPFDAATTPAHPEIGALAEAFRRYPGVRVNDHAAARFAALGPQAAPLLEPTPLHDYYGPGSVLQRFTDLGGSVLRLGADTNTVTLTHWAEYLAQVPAARRVRVRYLRADGAEQHIESLDDSLGIVDWPHGDYFDELLAGFFEAGHARHGPVGACRAELFVASTYVDFAVPWLETRLAGAQG